MYVVCVTFELHSDHVADFMPLMTAQAENSLSLEPECYQFDVCSSADGTVVFLYEKYRDRAAFDVHLASEHFRDFDAAVAPMIAQKTVQTYQMIV